MQISHLPDDLTRTLEQNGVHVRRNQYEEVELNGSKIMLVGIDDCFAGMGHPPEVPDTGDFTIYMIHEPKCRVDWKADLILAGHTYGGQFITPGLDKIISGGVLEPGGRIDKNSTTTYITRGLGTSNMEVKLRPPDW